MKKKYCYWLSTFENIRSNKSLLDYSIQAKKIIKKYKGKMIFKSETNIKLEGKKYKRIVCFRFKNISDAKKCYSSTEYKKIKKIIRKKVQRNINLFLY